MIALDTSVLAALLFDEPEAPLIANILGSQACVIGAPTVLEAHLVIGSRMRDACPPALAAILGRSNIRTVSFGAGMLDIALGAFEAYGRGRGHPAQLNYGDCMAYAVAKAHDAPLLYKGDDFAKTDIPPAWALFAL